MADTRDTMQCTSGVSSRIYLRLPKYVSLRLLHESACVPTIKERLHQLGRNIVAKMKVGNPLIHKLVEEKEADNIHAVRSQGLNIQRSHHSPLDIILPAKLST